jgi:ESS family glutamate:Na+ symporter
VTDATRAVLTDFGIVSIAIIAAHLIRYKIKWIQATYMPSSVIAGIICLFLGREFFNILSFSLAETGKLSMASYPSWLVVFLFATLFMGHRKKAVKLTKTIEHAGDTFFFNLASLVGQYGFALLFGMLILTPLFPMLPEGFAIFLPAGFIGGYGTAAAMGSVFEQGGWEGAMTLGNASATVGMMAAIFAGMVIVNIATRKGWTRMVSTMQKMPESMRSGFVPVKERKSLGHETVSPMALDALTWHMCLVVAVALSAFYVRDFIQEIFQSQFTNTIELPVFGLGLLIGAALQGLFETFGIGQYVDRSTIHRIGSLVTDYLIVFGIASITTHVVLTNAVPLLLLFVFGFTFTICLMWFVGRRIFRNFWFERSIAMYGWNTGSVATSVALLRVIDPDLKTPVLEDFGLAYIGISFVEIAIIAMLPPLILNGIIAGPTLVLLLGFVVCLLLSRLLVGWFKYPSDALRPGEEEVINAPTVE